MDGFHRLKEVITSANVRTGVRSDRLSGVLGNCVVYVCLELLVGGKGRVTAAIPLEDPRSGI